MVLAVGEDDVAYEAAAREAVELARTSGDTLTLAASLSNLSDAALRQRRFAEAQGLAEESLAAFQRLGDPFDTAGVLANLAAAALELGDVVGARAWLAAAAAAAKESRSNERYAWVLDGLAALAHGSGAPERAARLTGAGALLAEHDIALGLFEQARRARTVAELRTILGGARFDRAYEEGAALTPVEALDLGLSRSEG
jgi:hypothetical protein